MLPPETQFDCNEQIEGGTPLKYKFKSLFSLCPGYYADTDADCQAFHICAPDGSSSLLKYSFLCPNGTLFNQQYFICDWWFNVDCSQAPTFYSLNADIAAAAAAANDNREGRNLDVAEITDLKNIGDFSGQQGGKQGKGRKFSG